MDFVCYTAVKLQSNAAIVYNQYERLTPAIKGKKYNTQNLTRGVFKGRISPKAAKRIKELVVNMHLVANEKILRQCIYKDHKTKPLSFITLTLSDVQVHDDNYIKRNLLDKFLIYMQRKGFLKRYIWKAEVQKNGNIHFHIVTPDYINYELVRNVWNNIQKTEGYTDKYAYFHGHHNPPSTEIKACKSINHTAYYIAKYMAKSDGSREIKGRLWGCSDKIRVLRTPISVADQEVMYLLDRAVNNGELTVKELEHCRIYMGDIYKFMSTRCTRLAEYYIQQVQANWLKMQEVQSSAYIPLLPKEPEQLPKTEHQLSLF